MNYKWNNFKEANRFYHQIDKEREIIPTVDTFVFSRDTKFIFYIPNERYLQRYIEEEHHPNFDTFPVKYINHVTNYDIPQKLKKTRMEKADESKWEYVKIRFTDFKEEKICVKNIFKFTIDKYQEPSWTSKQKEWINNGVKLSSIFTLKLNTISKIEDFRRKYFMRYWNYFPYKECSLCNEEFERQINVDHIIYECKKVKKWEKKLKINSDERKINNFDHNSLDHTSSWIQSWCLWKNYWQIVFKSFEKSSILEYQISNFTKLLKYNEYLHLKYLLLFNKKNIDTKISTILNFLRYTKKILSKKRIKFLILEKHLEENKVKKRFQI